jgi:hypothetical protein
MLEIIGILLFTNRVGTIAKRKGVDGCLYQFLVVALWIVGEIIGIIIGVIITEGEESGICISYIFALVGAIIGPGIILLYVNHLPDAVKEEERIAFTSTIASIKEPTKEWECPKCKNKNSNTSFVCSNCGFKL